MRSHSSDDMKMVMLSANNLGIKNEMFRWQSANKLCDGAWKNMKWPNKCEFHVFLNLTVTNESKTLLGIFFFFSSSFRFGEGTLMRRENDSWTNNVTIIFKIHFDLFFLSTPLYYRRMRMIWLASFNKKKPFKMINTSILVSFWFPLFKRFQIEK